MFSFTTSNPKIEALNQTQKDHIEGMINHVLFSITHYDPNLIMIVLTLLCDTEISYDSILKAPMEIWRKVEDIYDILTHQHPQNMNEGDYSIEQPSDSTMVNYINKHGDVICEKKGILNLTIKNDDSALPVTKTAVVSYIRLLLQKKLESKLQQAHIIANTKYYNFLDINNNIFDISTLKIKTNDVFYLCLFLDRHLEIKKLALDVNYLSSESVSCINEILNKMPNLTYLKVTGLYANNMTTVCKGIKNLRSLIITGNINDNCYPDIVELIQQNTNLCDLVIEGMDCYHTNNKNKKVPIQITLRGSGIGDTMAIGIAKAIPNVAYLKNISIKGGSIGDLGATAIANAIIISKFQLNSFNIEGDWISDAGAIAISNAIKQMCSLYTLRVHGHHIGNQGAISIANAIIHNKHCKGLTLFGYFIDDSGAIAIAKALHGNGNNSEYLSSLNLTGGDIGNSSAIGLKPASGVKALACNINITSLMINGEYINKFEETILAETNPVKKANYGIELGFNIKTPSLLQQSLFAVKQIHSNQNNYLKNEDDINQFNEKFSCLPEELIEKITYER
jgi:hypothetical protein